VVKEYKRLKDTLTVVLEGELDHHTAEKVRNELDMLIDDISIKNLILDLKYLSFMDSSGVGVILGRYKAIMKRNGSIAVKNANPQIDKILEISGLYRIIKKLN